MQVELNRREGQVTARLVGELDHHGAGEIREAIDEAVLRHRVRRLELDFSGLTFMDSSGVGLIMGRFALVRRYGGKLAVADPSAAVLKMMQLAGMEKMIPIKYTKKGRC